MCNSFLGLPSVLITLVSFLHLHSLPPAQAIASAVADDQYLRKLGDRPPTNSFSSSSAWKHLHENIVDVPWHKAVWFKGRIQKHAFISWLAARNRLSTRDRMRNWNTQAPSSCLLCSASDELRQHLFFDCEFSRDVWSFFTDRANLSSPAAFDEGLGWLKDLTGDRNVVLIMKLAFQASIYFIWKERDSSLHRAESRPPQVIILEIKNTLRLKLDILSRQQRLGVSQNTFLATWIQLFDQ